MEIYLWKGDNNFSEKPHGYTFVMVEFKAQEELADTKWSNICLGGILCTDPRQ